MPRNECELQRAGRGSSNIVGTWTPVPTENSVQPAPRGALSTVDPSSGRRRRTETQASASQFVVRPEARPSFTKPRYDHGVPPMAAKWKCERVRGGRMRRAQAARRA